MRILVTGATGLVGRRIVLDRLRRGDRVVVLSRDPDRATRLFAGDANPNILVIGGDPSRPGPWQAAVDGLDAVIHLAGAGLTDRRWSKAYKRTLVESRVESGRNLVEAIESASARPRILVSASAVGYYGDTGSQVVDESAGPGTDFLARLCVDWEASVQAAEPFDVRVTRLRFGVVLDDRGGALEVMAKPFRMFAGGPIGLGRHYVSWIHWRDLVGLVDVALRDPRAAGAVNATSPEPVTNLRLSRAIAGALGRPCWLPVPPIALRLALGEVAKFITMSQRVEPARALQLGYRFVHGDVERAVETLVDAPPEDTADSAVAVTARAIAEGASDTRPPSPPRLVAIDVDGTLLRRDGQLAHGVLSAIREARKRGVTIVLATGRTPRGLRSIAETLEVDGPTINYNGALIWHPKEGRALYHEPIAPDLAAEIVRVVREAEPEILLGIEVVDRWFTDRVDAEYRSPLGRLVEPDDTGPLERFLGEPVTRVSLLGPPERIDALCGVVRGQFRDHRKASMYRNHPTLLQVLHPMADKGIGLQRIATRMGIDRSGVMAIGDGDNDLGMLEWAGFSVAVANAAPAVRRLADAVVPQNDDNGVALALQRYVLS